MFVTFYIDINYEKRLKSTSFQPNGAPQAAAQLETLEHAERGVAQPG